MCTYKRDGENKSPTEQWGDDGLRYYTYGGFRTDDPQNTHLKREKKVEGKKNITYRMLVAIVMNGVHQHQQYSV